MSANTAKARVRDRSGRDRAPRFGLRALRVCALGLLQCSPERTVLLSAESGAGGGSAVAGSSADPGSAAADAGGAQPSGGTSAGAGAAMSGSAVGGSGAGAGGSMIAAGGSAHACTQHADCSAGEACIANVCTPCAASAMQCPVCSSGFTAAVVTRNGCPLCECVPPSTCTSARDCASDEVCYPGAQCQEGCSTPDCCYGNHCAKAGCGSTVGLNCGAVGCPAGGQCFSACTAPTCTCDGAAWQCTGDGAAGASSSCLWVCTSR